jgi:hypothetical protein
LGLPEIPVVALYQKDYWPHNLSSMIRGITADRVSGFRNMEYDDPNQAPEFIKEIMEGLWPG